MQILHTGDIVRARRRTWRITDVRPFDGCRTVCLSGTGANSGASCELLTPFDQIERVAEPARTPRRVGTAQWRRAAQELIGRSGAPGLLHASAAAGIDVLPHQLEPVVAVLRGSGCRLLLADEVGLGKTIQACLLVLELRARAAAERILILTPPGLRDQWRDELECRFGIDAAKVDARAVRRRTSEIPPDINAWTTWPTVITSIDYVKRPEVLRAIIACRWDVVIIDEAHRVANDGDRREAASALTSGAAYVVLLTATPHSGDAAAFEALCDLGSHGDRLLVFRRTRRALASAASRHIHRLYIRSPADELRLQTRLETFAQAVRAEHSETDREMWIALALLRKRAYSSARALYLSVIRRLDALAGTRASTVQLLLPLDDEGELAEADEPPPWQPALGLQDADREHRLLSAIADAAAVCASREPKIVALRRLLRRVAEPVIIFTEYRDTLTHLAREIGEPSAMLHGGLSAAERKSALDSFARGRQRILLATDAAAEGLNLHQICRVVVNLELPWNPMRLEQRIGRVDRIGQTRTVHAFHLVGRDSGELQLLEDLRTRIAHAQSAIGAPDPLDGALNEPDSEPVCSDTADISAELQRLRLMRALSPRVSHDSRPLTAAARNRRTRQRLRTRVLTLWECAVEDATERTIASRLFAVAHDDSQDVGASGENVVRAISAQWQHDAAQTATDFCQTAIDRSMAMGRAIAQRHVSPLQPGLFDRRAHFATAALQAAQREAVNAQAERQADLRRACQVSARPPRLRLVLVPAHEPHRA